MTATGPLRQAWTRLAVRERRLVVVALVVLAAGLLWAFGVAPALATVRSAPLRLVQLDTQLQTMQGLAAQARVLQARAPIRRDEALRTLESSVQQRLAGKAQISTSSDRVTVTLTGVDPQPLAQWLSQVRAAARVSIQQARLLRGPAGWGGSIILQLPPE